MRSVYVELSAQLVIFLVLILVLPVGERRLVIIYLLLSLGLSRLALSQTQLRVVRPGSNRKSTRLSETLKHERAAPSQYTAEPLTDLNVAFPFAHPGSTTPEASNFVTLRSPCVRVAQEFPILTRTRRNQVRKGQGGGVNLFFFSDTSTLNCSLNY